MPKPKDPTDPIRVAASKYPGVDEGTACTQSSFKANKKSFLFIGKQGGRYKAMFKLNASIPQASRLADQDPDLFQVGSSNWVTARFTSEEPLPKSIWKKWLDESYESTQSAKSVKKRTTKKKAAKKKAAAKKKNSKKKAAKRSSSKKKSSRTKKATKKRSRSS